MPPPPATADLYTTLQRYQLLLLTAGRRLWGRMAPADFDGSWLRIAPQMVAFTAGAQLAAAQAAAVYVPAALDQQGIDAPPQATVSPQVFSGVAFDGRPLDTLLEGAVARAKDAARSKVVIGDDGLRHFVRGMDGGDALKLGQRWLEGALQTIVTDAARDMTAAEIAVRPKVAYVRMVNPPCCSRCAVLAGRVYSFATPFPRHPRCDCLQIPTTVANGKSLFTDPRELARQGQITDLTVAQRSRLDDGADLVKVLNESRDAWRARMAVERKRAKRASAWGTNTPTPLPAGGIQDFLNHLTSRVDAINEMKRRGIAA